MAVIDSIQTVYSDELTSAPGSVAQVRECAAQLTRVAKASGTTIVLVGHVTKEGALAGPRVLEHMVDTVLYFEGDTHSSFRLVRAIKNRFGAVNEIGVFAMTEKGLKGVANPSAIFLSHARRAGRRVAACWSRSKARGRCWWRSRRWSTRGGPSPRRLSVGLDRDRLAMLLAVLHRHAGVAVLDQDVFVNAVGGVRISEPAADLAVMLAIQCSLRGKPLPRGFIAFGEVGLAGEVRPAPRGQERLREAAKLGFSVAIVPKANAPKGAAARPRRPDDPPGRAHRGSDRTRALACERATGEPAARLGARRPLRLRLLARLTAGRAWRSWPAPSSCGCCCTSTAPMRTLKNAAGAPGRLPSTAP